MKKGVFWCLLGFIVILSSFMLSCGEKENSSKTIKNDGNTCKITVRGDGDGSVAIKDYLQTENVNILLGSRITVLAYPMNCDFAGWYVNDPKDPVCMSQEFSFIVSSDAVLYFQILFKVLAEMHMNRVFKGKQYIYYIWRFQLF